MDNFTFGNETENCLSACYHESADVLYAQPVRRPPNAGVRLYCCDVGALLPQMVSTVIAASPELPAPQRDWRPRVSVHP